MHAIDPRLPIAKLNLMTDVVADAVRRERFNTLLFALFGGVALVLAAVGLYGVMAFLVTQRTREIGIRLALGGQPGRVLRGVIAEGLWMTTAGLAIGFAVALALSVLLLASTTVASYLPARRATRVDPVEVLRS